ncbi:phosphonate-binding protein [Terribacillus saccharophilus]|uniref:Phosphonate-binding protein n=1 Tax=Terribacillus saccharophilus TaxID=361277 RepID=A0A268HIE0_9BACI|nr:MULTISPECIES: phosphate/phosphite/phosphonate ABC transporter substrate-binding protein [Terribacillus]PAD35437.1 phosphonate-binding protein [Terribacillus saccharophilus]PAD96192.1 phosphonate-binding protein [Terribacillus saccharophilus]PAD99473.1 phosphonate-binding protein [Terribacillus saccharophilus]PAE09623.1 phosphonate-binding protein [Terribacillus saccharophilus]
MFKKIAGVGATLFLAAGLLSACGSDDSSAEGEGSNGDLKELRVQFVPSQNAETLEAKAEPLADLLEEELDIPVEVSVSTNYNTIIEAMASGQVDVGFLPPTAYVLAHDKDAAEVILQSQRYGVNPEDGSPTDELVDFYLAQFVVKSDSGIDSLEDLKDKTIAVQDVTSSAGYVWPAGALDAAGLDIQSDLTPTTVKGHDAGIISVLNGDTDAAVTFQDARNVVKGDYPTVFEDTKVIATTEKIPNDTIAVTPEINDEWKEKITDAFINIGKDPEGLEIIRDVYTHEGYVKSDDSKFEVVREYSEKFAQE